ncbi:uncharacterized protein LOC135640990 [Musa acuminata AAA Group]|uniref:(wild Malaysian banana) hypothetical protein n=1 Tax=Musa acuminata subsp. malaccensis TaxID=214687 RepID=A0A804JDC9_MUSAM|nr:PREDICTED: uncharacterized protein LOC103986990 [Musa acuminata subsp. malaccensis]XP_009403435.1 PREDICTED: uncharacterized protein LOC103986990 [Musa acuminata subsp. malaccensis]XP_018683192.1 PREDICTED: uncharacterized protein LOC103986990 [Musa acuminata subsp. malaccensis]CAG1845474.1 unnamed protein product [Musa acuminata subsp. malaccensis]
MDSEHGRESSEYYNANQGHEKAGISGVKVDNPDLPKPAIKPKTVKERSCSNSSSSSTSSEEEFFQLDASELGKPMAVVHEMQRNDLQPSLRVENTQVEAGLGSSKGPTEISFSSYDSNGSPGSDNSGNAGTKQSPPVQSMYRSDVPDPNRIPSSVFARTKSTTPMEWSVASNESLFSIHMGKSGDLTGLYGSQLDGYPPISPMADITPTKRRAGPGLQQTVEYGAANDEAMKDDVLKTTIEENAENDKSRATDGIRHSDSTSQFSDGGSVNSYRSFAFPILTAEGRNGSVKESVRPAFQKEQLEQPLPQTEHQEAEPPKEEPVAAQKTWLSCFSCCSSRC